MDPSTILFIISASLFLILVYKRSGRSYTNLPPSPRSFPVIGNLHQLAGGELPHRALARLSKSIGPVMRLRLGEVNFIVISSAAAAREVTKTHDLLFANRPMIYIADMVFSGDGLGIAFAPYGAHWRALRRLVSFELLSSRRVKSFASIRRNEVDTMINNIASVAATNGIVNLGDGLKSMANNIVARAAFGNEYSKLRDKFLKAVGELIAVAAGFNVIDMYPSMKLVLEYIAGVKFSMTKIANNMLEIMDHIVDEHEKKLKNKVDGGENLIEEEDEEDMVDVMLKTAKDKTLEIPFTKKNIKSVLLEIFIAGTDTTSSIIEWAFAELIKNPNVMAKAQQEVRQVLAKSKGYVVSEDMLNELHYLRLVVKETLRLHPPVPLLLPRANSEMAEVLGYAIPPGCRTMINVWQIMRDPSIWDEPENFKPERFEVGFDFKGSDYEYLPFGSGRRICPGMTFGLATVDVAMAQLLYHFDWELPSGTRLEDLDMSETFGATARKNIELHLVPKPYREA